MTQMERSHSWIGRINIIKISIRTLRSSRDLWCPSPLSPWTVNTQDKQPQHSPEALLAGTQISGLGFHNWNPGWAHTLISGPAAWEHRHKVPGWARTSISSLGTPTWNLGWVCTRISGWLPLAQTQSQGSATQPHQQPGCLLATTPKSTGSEQLPPAPCAQRPAGPTGSLEGRQNTQQRRAAGLWETAVPGKTWPSKGMNYPGRALRDPSI